MITLIWKELRENARWAVLALLILGATEVYALYPRDTQEQYYGGMFQGVTLLRPAFLTVTTFGCAGIGLLFGLLQILPELKRDRWAALLHRPMSHGAIFRGKITAGLILYLGATVPPFLLAVWMAATPGHFDAPFVPAMIQPGVADICMGMVYYFAAIVMTLPRSGWLVARALPLLAALHASYFVLNQMRFNVAVEAAVLMALALFTAAWGEFLKPHSLRERPWLGKVAILAVAIYGACGLQDLAHSFMGVLKSPPGPNFERYEFTREGVPLRLVYSHKGLILQVLDVNGKPFSDPQYKPELVRNHMQYFNTFSSNIGDPHNWKPRVYKAKYRELRDYFWGNSPYSSPRLEQWFYMDKERYMIGFWPDKTQPFGYLDGEGFEPITAKPKPFPHDLELGYATESKYVLWSPNSARFASLANRTLKEIELPGPGPIYGCGSGWGVTAHGSTAIFGLVIGTGVAVYDVDAKPVALVPYHHDTTQWGMISLGTNGNLDRFYLYCQPSAYLPDHVKKTMPSFMDILDKQGNLLQSFTMPPLPPDPRGPRSWQGFIEPRTQSPVGYFGTMAYKGIGGTVFRSKRLAGDLAGQFKPDHIGETIELSTYIVCFGLLLAAIAFAMAYRACFGTARALQWAAFVFFFSLPGLIAFWLCADWPSLVSCPVCGRRRPVRAAQCPHCGAAWPPPPANGVELFDEARLETAGQNVLSGK